MYRTTLSSQVSVQTTYSKLFLSIGELVVADKPMQVWTVLGSCVSVVLHNPRLKVSALCHAQLAEEKVFGKVNGTGLEQYAQRTVMNDFRYVEHSICYMLEQLQCMGIKKHEITASVYGGANMIELFTFKVGTENLNATYRVLEENGIGIIRQDVGGNKSRTIRHFTDTGVTHVRKL